MSTQAKDAHALNSVWGRRALDLPPDVDFNTRIQPDDIAFLAKHCAAYIQVINSQAVLSGMTEALLIGPDKAEEPACESTPPRWVIHDYGEAMSVSPGDHLFERPSDLSGQAPPGQGSLTKQTVDIASKLVNLAIEKGWAGIEIISGVRLIEWAVWKAGQDQGFEIFGFEPTKEEKAKRDRIKALENRARDQEAEQGKLTRR